MLTLVWLLGAAIITYGLVAAVFWLRQPRMVYRPQEPAEIPEGERAAAVEELWLRSSDGVRLHARYFSHPDPAGAVLFCHGNTSDVSRCGDVARMYLRLGFEVLLFDYRGYGLSEGRPSEEGTYRDVAAAWEYLLRERSLSPGNIVVAGRSLGAAIAVWLAARTQPRALILESAFTSLAEVAAQRYRWLPVRYLMRYRYSVAEEVTRVRCPLLIIHSREDEIVPYAHALRLCELAPDPKDLLTISGPHRDDRRPESGLYEEGIARFLARHRQRGVAAR